MTAALWVSVLGFFVTISGSIAVGFITSRNAKRAAEASATATKESTRTAAEEGAYLRAKELLEAGIEEQAERIARIVDDLKATRDQLGETVRDLADTRRELRLAREEISTLRRSVSQYEGRVIQLTEVLRLHKIDVPPWTLNPSDYGMLPGSIPDPGQPPRITSDAVDQA